MSQCERLSKAGYPVSVQVSMAAGILTDLRNDNQHNRDATAHYKTNIVPLFTPFHTALRRLLSERMYAWFFSAPSKLVSICKLANSKKKVQPVCDTSHRPESTVCISNAVYQFPPLWADRPLPKCQAA